MCERWLDAHAELHEKRLASSLTPVLRPKQGAWQPPPIPVFVGCSTTQNKKLWQKCLSKIQSDVASETSQHFVDNMKACLEWVKLHGYPSTNYFLLWAACGIATCTTLKEFSRFWAAHSQSPERKSVYAMQVAHGGRDKVVCWQHGLASANLGAPPLRIGYEQTWPEKFVGPERLDEVPCYLTELRSGGCAINLAP